MDFAFFVPDHASCDIAFVHVLYNLFMIVQMYLELSFYLKWSLYLM
jgi:hypothetical protein